MNEEQFLNLEYKDYDTPKKVNQILEKAQMLEQTKEVKEKIQEITIITKYLGLKDFYPTPDDLARNMVKWAKEVYSCRSILEPSAGTGSIANAIKEHLQDEANNLECVEINPEFCDILKAQGFNVHNQDFSDFVAFKKYDVIIANPPFSKLKKHTQKCMDLLSPDGYFSSIVPPNKSAIQNLTDEYGFIFYELNYQACTTNPIFSKCLLLECDRRQINELKNDLKAYFLDGVNDFVSKHYRVFLCGGYGNDELFDKLAKTYTPSNEALFSYLKKFIEKEYEYSPAFADRLIEPYKNMGHVLLDTFRCVYKETHQGNGIIPKETAQVA